MVNKQNDLHTENYGPNVERQLSGETAVIINLSRRKKNQTTNLLDYFP